jgi:predicted dehydrogenase
MTVSRPVKACLVGIGGYGKTYLKAFATLKEQGLAELSAMVVRNPAKYAEKVAELEAEGVKCYTTLDGAIDAGGFDFLVLCGPLQTHRPMTLQALEAGIPVLCEKSAAPTVQDVQEMTDAAERTGVPLDIAYPQQSASNLIAAQKALIDGVIGKVSHVTVCGGWLRHERYYERSAWAGRVKVDGLWTLDGPINNPLAHYVFAGMYLASSNVGQVANPSRVRGELYRGRPTIEGEDTACIHAEFDNGVSQYCYISLLAADDTYRKVRVDVHGADGIVSWSPGGTDEPIRGERTDGTPVVIEHEGAAGSTLRCTENFARYLLGESDVLYSPITESLKFARLSNGAFDSSGKVHQIPAEHVNKCDEPIDEYKFVKRYEGETTLVYDLPGICGQMKTASEARALFSDIGVPWAVKTDALDVSNYTHFPQAYEPVELPWS